jgi:hypothetical protein
MISSLQELERIKNEYYRWYTSGTRSCQEKAAEVASDNFNWVLDTAIGLHEEAVQ